MMRQFTRRHLALAAVYDGATRTEATRIGGVTRQIVLARAQLHGERMAVHAGQL
jgi:hypothetical protein